jgi:homoserine O-acetyltransferase/O-succinyltransferase
MSDLKNFKSDKPLVLESGKVLKGIEIAYHTYGQYDPDRNNVVWICHAFTANSDAADWWPGIIGKGWLFDPDKHFIVCANILGSCYGSTGPLSVNPDTGSPWYLNFPALTVRDLVAAHELLRKHLGIKRIHTVVGGSIGAHQAMEWAIMQPDIFDHLIIIAAGAYYTPWGIAINESQRLALLADPSFHNETADAGQAGLIAARSIALLSYRNYIIYNKTQAEDDPEKTGDFKASSYQRYQGEKLVRRFHAHPYYTLLNILDSHNVGRGRGGVEKALAGIKARTLVVGITSDYLFATHEQISLAAHIPGAVYCEIDSLYGHDGFLVEVDKVTETINDFYST